MTNSLLLAALTTFLFACNSNTNTDTSADSTTHSGHHSTTVNDAHVHQANAITATMDKMMQEMHSAKPTNNNDIDFAVMMVAHHQGAVEMSKVEIAQGTNDEMKAFAQQVIDDQQKEITFMQDFISKAPKTASSNATSFQKALNGSMMAMMNNNTTIYDNIDKDFAVQMIPHHQSAVDMAQAYLQYGQNAGLKTLCQNIISSQTKEIAWLRQWLAKNEK